MEGEIVPLPLRATNLGLSASSISTLFIESTLNSVGVEIAHEGNVSEVIVLF